MRMRVRLGAILTGIMTMLMVRVVDMQMIVGQVRMPVLVLVPLGEVQPESGHHQTTGAKQLSRDRLPKQDDSDQCTREGCDGKVGARSGSSEMPQGNHKKHQTEAITGEPDRPRGQYGGGSRH